MVASKIKSLNFAGFLGMCCFLSQDATAQLLVFDPNPDIVIPDGSATGTTHTGLVSGLDTAVDYRVAVTLNLAGNPEGFGFNGDLFVNLTHQNSGDNVILINRPGKTAANGFGYDDSGFKDLTFVDGAADIHLYQASATAGDYVAEGGSAGITAWIRGSEAGGRP